MLHGKGGVPQDYAEALKWFRKAAEQGHAEAQYRLVMSYTFGFGVPKDNAEAIKWCRKAAEQGHAAAQYKLGNCYFRGIGVADDDVAAYAWHSVAAASGYEKARNMLGVTKSMLTASELEKGEAMAREISERIEKRRAGRAE